MSGASGIEPLSDARKEGLMQNNHRVALVTGGSGGIGRITAARLARGGFEVAVNYAGSKDAAEEVVSAITHAGGSAMRYRATWRTRSP